MHREKWKKLQVSELHMQSTAKEIQSQEPSVWNLQEHIREVTLCVCLCVCVSVCSVSQSCRTLCHSTGYSPPASSVHGISQARILGWVAIPYPRGSSLTTNQEKDKWLNQKQTKQTLVQITYANGQEHMKRCSTSLAISKNSNQIH